MPDICQERGAKTGWVEGVKVHHCKRLLCGLEPSTVETRIDSIEEFWAYG